MNYLTISSPKKNMQYLAVCIPFFLVGCSSGQLSGLQQTVEVPTRMITAEKSATAWVVMDPPLRSPRVAIVDENGEETTKSWAQLENKKILNILSNTRSEISVGKYNTSGEITYLVANATGEIGTYKVIMDYTPYLVQDAIDPDTKKKIGYARVGLGLRLTANINTNVAGINLGSLMALGLAAKSNQLQGSMHVDTIGIRINNNSGMILSSTTIDETSILKALEALAVIQSKIADKDTYLDPQVIWVKPLSKATEPEKVAGDMSKKEKQ